tara:strand:+ start:6067 stop:6285 length:219 start_codon:yes stop_codon:yes gene_type:complete
MTFGEKVVIEVVAICLGFVIFIASFLLDISLGWRFIIAIGGVLIIAIVGVMLQEQIGKRKMERAKIRSRLEE